MPSLTGESFRAALTSRLAPTDLLSWTERTCVLRGSPYVVPPCYQAIYASTAPRLFIRKAAQTFASQYLVHVALWCCATVQGKRGNSLYVFPAEKQGGDFCRARIEPVIKQSPKLAALVGATDNVYMKAIGSGFLYMRGGQTDKGLITVDVDLAALDEVARYPAGTLEMIDPRLSSSYLAWQRAVSTPVFPSDQAGQLWDRSTQSRYHVRCSHCSTWQPLEVEDTLQPDTGLVLCAHCGGDMTEDRLGEGHWEAEHPSGDWEGYQVNKLLSHRVDLAALAKTYRDVLRGDVSQAAVQQFHNQDCGHSYLPKGGHLDADLLDACCSDPAYTRMPSVGTNCVMGVDVGGVLHVVIFEPRNGLFYLVFAGTVDSFAEVGTLMHRYDVRRCVVDAEPETHAARTFCDDRAWHGRVSLATYVEDQGANKANLCRWDDDSHTVRINRTMALDTIIHYVTTRRMVWPAPALLARELGGGVNQAGVGAFYRQLCAPVRVLVLNARGQQVARYAENGPDHYGHAAAYAVAAADQAVGEMGVPPPPPERDPDPDDPWGETSPIDAFFRQHTAAARQMDRQYSRRPTSDGFVTGSGKHVPANDAAWVAANDYTLADAHRPPDPGGGDDLPPLDFTYAFGPEG